MVKCNDPRDPFVGSGRNKEGGFLAVHKQDFNAHISGQAYRHCSDQIDMTTELEGCGTGATVQQAIESLAACVGSGLFVSIGIADGYAEGDYNVGDTGIATLEAAFAAAFADPHVQNGGVIVIKSGTYTMTSTVTIPAGITIWGEPAGAIINGKMNEDPMFIIGTAKSPSGLGYEAISEVVAKSDPQKTKFWNLTLIHNLNKEGGFTSTVNPMIAVEDGAQFIAEQSSFFGFTQSGLANSSERAIGRSATTITTNPTSLEVINCLIDGFSGGIEFASTNGATDRLVVKDTRVRYLGTGTPTAAIDTTLANITITGNIFLGENDGGNFLAATPIVLSGNAVSDDNVRAVISNNSGGLTSGAAASAQSELFDSSAISTASSSGILKGVLNLNNSWGLELNSKNFFMTVGDGVNSIGDITGANALDIVFDRANQLTGFVPIVYVGNGEYTATNNQTNNPVSLIGMGTGFSQRPIIRINWANADADDFGNRTCWLFKEVRNIEFRRAVGETTPHSITIRADSFGFMRVHDCTFQNVPVIVSPGSNNNIIEGCLFEQFTNLDDYISLMAETSGKLQLAIRNCSFKGSGYALTIANDSFSSSSQDGLVSLEGCRFDIYDGVSGEQTISSAIPTLPWVGFKQRYIWIDVGDYTDFEMKDCRVKCIDISQGWFEPVDQTLVNGGTHDVWIEIAARRTMVKNNLFDLPDQPIYSSNALVPSLFFTPITDLNIDSNAIRGNLPVTVSGSRIIAQSNSLQESPSISINNNKIKRYQRDNSANNGGDIWGAMDCINIVLDNWLIPANSGSFNPYPQAQVSIFNNDISGMNQFADSVIEEFTFGNNPNLSNPIPSAMVGALVFVSGEGWGINVSENLLDGWVPKTNFFVDGVDGYHSTLTVRNAPDISGDAWHWGISATVSNNRIIHATSSYIGDGQRSVGLYLRGANSMITSNFFTFLGINNDTSATSDSNMGWLEIDYEPSVTAGYINTIINNNIFHRNGDTSLPQSYGIYLNERAVPNDSIKGIMVNNIWTRELGIKSSTSFSRIRTVPKGWKIQEDDPLVNDNHTGTTVTWSEMMKRGLSE